MSKFKKEEALEIARELMRRCIVVDGLTGGSSERFIEDLQKGGVNAVNDTVSGHNHTVKSAFMSMLSRRWLVERMPDRCLLATTTEDIQRAKQENKVALIAGWQGAEPILDDYHWVEVFHEYGLRILQFTYNEGNALGAGCLEPRDSGLTFRGINLVRECNKLGIVIDCSHTGERTTLDMIEHSKKPCIFSHSNPKAVRMNARNISDEQIKACAGKGGVIGCPIFADFVGNTTDGRRPTVEEWVRCVNYVVELVGIDHVGIGSDISTSAGGWVQWVNNTKRMYPEICGGMDYNMHEIEGIDHSHATFPLLASALIQNGYEEKDMVKILGSNWLRVFREVWRA